MTAFSTIIEQSLTEAIVNYGTGDFFVDIEAADGEGNIITVCAEGTVSGRSHSVSIDTCTAYDENGDEVQFRFHPDLSKIELAAEERIRENEEEERDIRETQECLKWGGWFA